MEHFVYLLFLPCREWDANRLARGESTLQRMCNSCLLVLSVPAVVHRETATHASAVLVRSALAIWRANGRWPSSSFFVSTEPMPILAAVAAAEEAGSSEPIPEQEEGATPRLAGAAGLISQSFFPGRQGRGAGTDDAADATTALVAGFMPLPPSSSLAVCRALLHIVHPRVLLAGFAPDEEPAEGRPPVMANEKRREKESADIERPTGEGGATRQGNLMLGPIFSVILRHGSASSGSSLRFLALQVRMTIKCPAFIGVGC